MFFVGLQGVTNNFFIPDGQLLSLTVPNNIYSVATNVSWTYVVYPDNTILNLNFSNLNTGLIDVSCNAIINYSNIKVIGLLGNYTSNTSNYILTATVQYGSHYSLNRTISTLPISTINTVYTCNITYQSITILWSYYTYSGACNLNILLSNIDNSQLLSNVNNVLIGNKVQTLSNLNQGFNYNYQLNVYDPYFYGNYLTATSNFQTLPLGTINTLQTCNITWGSTQVYWTYSNYPGSCNVTITLSNTNYNAYSPSQVSNIPNIPLSNNTVIFSNMSNASNYTITAQVYDQWFSNYSIITPIIPLPHGIINSFGVCNITYQSVQLYWTYSNYPGSCNTIINLLNNGIIIQTSNNPLSNNTITMTNLNFGVNYQTQMIVYDQWYSNAIASCAFTSSNEGFIFGLTSCNINYNSAVLTWSNVNYPPNTQATLLITSPYGESSATSGTFTTSS